MEKIKIALIGYGHLGKWHLEKALSFNFVELIGVVDPSDDVGRKLKELHPELKWHKDLRAIINQLDAALIVCPTSFHYNIAKELIKNNIHVFCEKPMTESLDQCKELVELLKNKEREGKNLTFQVGHSERIHQAWEILKNDFATDSSFDFSKVELCKFTRVSPFKSRATDVDIISDLMIHDLDLMAAFFGRPQSVEAYGYKVISQQEDYCLANFQYPQTVVRVEASRSSAFTQRSVEFIWNHNHIHVDLLNNKIIRTLQNGQVESMDYDKRDHLFEEQNYFYQSILKNNPVFINQDDGYKAVELVDITRQSAKQKCELKF